MNRLFLFGRVAFALASWAAALFLGYAYAQHPLPALDAAGERLLDASAAFAATAISACASAYGVAFVSIALFIVALLTRRGLAATAAVVCIQLVSAQSVSLAKLWFDRPRPIHHLVVEALPSYPSGHAAGAVAFYGGVTWLVWTSRLPAMVKRWLTCAAVLLIAAIGWSRVALGAHFVTDVIGGYLMGAAWLCAGTAVFDALTRRSAERLR